MLIVQGEFRLDPADRDRFIADSSETQRVSRAEAGCLEYVVAADPLDPGRVVLSERWATREALDAHLAALARRPQASSGGDATVPVERSFAFYEAVEVDVL